MCDGGECGAFSGPWFLTGRCALGRAGRPPPSAAAPRGVFVVCVVYAVYAVSSLDAGSLRAATARLHADRVAAMLDTPGVTPHFNTATMPHCQNNDTMKWYGKLLGNETVRRRAPNTPHSVLWLNSMNPANVFESTCTLISAIHLMQSPNHTERRWELRWHYAQQHYFARLRGQAAQMAAVFVKHVWRNARPLRPVAALAAPTCFANAAEVFSFSFLSEAFSGAHLERATKSFQRTVWRHFAVPTTMQPAASQAAREPVAVLLQRRGARAIVNEAEVVALIKARGFAMGEVLVPEEAPLTALLAAMRRASLVVTIHGAGMINMAFMPVGYGAVIEAFQPRMIYGTGFQLASACAFHHQPLLLALEDAELAPITASQEAFKASPFARWRERGGLKWNNDTLAARTAECGEERPRWAAGGLHAQARTMCGGIFKSLRHAACHRHPAPIPGLPPPPPPHAVTTPTAASSFL